MKATIVRQKWSPGFPKYEALWRTSQTFFWDAWRAEPWEWVRNRSAVAKLETLSTKDWPALFQTDFQIKIETPWRNKILASKICIQILVKIQLSISGQGREKAQVKKKWSSAMEVEWRAPSFKLLWFVSSS